jgi:hypothetical protein
MYRMGTPAGSGGWGVGLDVLSWAISSMLRTLAEHMPPTPWSVLGLLIIQHPLVCLSDEGCCGMCWQLQLCQHKGVVRESVRWVVLRQDTSRVRWLGHWCGCAQPVPELHV